MEIKRVSSGIPGFDKLIGGGFIKGSVNLITGEAGTGKTIFSTQFLWHGLQKGETGLYITLEEEPEDIREDVSAFGWDFGAMEEKGLCKIVFHDPGRMDSISSAIISDLKELEVKRLVIDSTAIIGLTIGKMGSIRRRIFAILSAIKRYKDCTSLVISEIPEGLKALSRFGVEEFLVDSVIVLNYLGIGEGSNRSLIVRKMRRTDHGKDVYPFEITKKGIVVKNESMSTVMR